MDRISSHDGPSAARSDQTNRHEYRHGESDPLCPSNSCRLCCDLYSKQTVFISLVYALTLYSHQTCRCVRCLTRYGHLGARTKESYTTSASPMSTPLTKSRLKSSLEDTFTSALSQDNHLDSSYAPDESFPLREATNLDFSLDPPVVVMESFCTVTDHLKVSLLSLSLVTSLFLPPLVSHSIDHSTHQRI
jgi:hypothetical protein